MDILNVFSEAGICKSMCDEIIFMLQHIYLLPLVQNVILGLVVPYLHFFLVADCRVLANCDLPH